MLGGIVEKWGPVLFSAAVFYSFVAMVLTIASYAGGLEYEVYLVPPVIQKMYSATYGAWSSVASQLGRNVTLVDLPVVMWNIGWATVNAVFSLLGLIVTAVFSYLFLAVAISRLIPPPFTIISIIVWIAASLAEIIIILYVIDRITPLINQIISTAASVFSFRR